MVDLSLSELMAMNENEFEKVIKNPEALKQIGVDTRHVQVVLFHMLRKNLGAIDDFSNTSQKSSRAINRLTWVIVVLMVVQILIIVINYL